MKVTRIGVAITLALIGLMVFLSSAAAEEPTASQGQPAEAPQLEDLLTNKYRPLVIGLQSPSSGIHVAALAALTCEPGEGSPVMGARITLITENGISMALTSQTGEALFSATSGSAVVQIEWPVGLVPCPNSTVSAELPAGAGEVQFVAMPIR